MKQAGILIFMGFFRLFMLEAQNINIPDQCLINSLIWAGVDTNGDELISYAEAEAVDTLILYSGCISDMQGLEAFSNLLYLQCNDNFELDELDLSGNTKLRHLQCGNNRLTSLNLSNNPDLEFLSCPYNRLTWIDISNCRKLEWFMCSFNELDSLDVRYNTQLTKLWCGYNNITSLDVSICPGLEVLQCPENNLKALDLTGLSSIESLNCGNNQLTRLELTDQGLLEYLSCYGNQLENIDLGNNLRLKSLDCSHNRLSFLDVSRNLELACMDCSSNPMTGLNISNNIALDTVGCDYASIDLFLCDMPSLRQVCVWELPFPPEGLSMDTFGSPNIVYTIDCTVRGNIHEDVLAGIFPNPARGLITIQTSKSGQYEVFLITADGKRIQAFSFTGDRFQLDLSPFEKGIYFLSIRSPGQVHIQKIVKL